MVNSEILSGLKYALSKGESLQRAMNSFLNSGYSREEVEEAARQIQIPQAPATPTYTQPFPQPTQTQPLPQQIPQQPIQQKQIQQPVQQQNISSTIKYRSPAFVLILSLITFGLYFLYWTISTTKELKANTTSAPKPFLILVAFFSLIIAMGISYSAFLFPKSAMTMYIFVALFFLATFIIMIYYFWKYSKAINELTGFSKAGLLVLFIFLSPIAAILAQIELNKKAVKPENNIPTQPVQQIQQPVQQIQKPVEQPVSAYESPKKQSGFSTGWIILLIVILVLLLGFLVATIFFKEQLLALFP